MDRVKGKAAAVTGSAGGIGEAMARLLAAEGAAVAILDIKDKEGKAVAADINKKGGKDGYWHTDVSQEAEVKKTMAEVFKQYGKLNILVNNAGVPGSNIPLQETQVGKLMIFNEVRGER